MMLDGTLCEGCGCSLPGHGDGIPRYCKLCRQERTAQRHEGHPAAARLAKCPHCSRKVKLVGLQDHIRDAHADLKTTAVAAEQQKLALIDAMEDMLNGWRYIRRAHGDLYGVGWDRAQEKMERALEALTGRPA
jgi:hypothetical protein